MVRVKRFCFCISLRMGSILIALIDTAVNLLLINFGKDVSSYHIEKAVAICHIIGCVMLIVGALMKAQILLVFYLITSLINNIILIVYTGFVFTEIGRAALYLMVLPTAIIVREFCL
ncbi:uncharacterized protein LOC115624881 [Scaptodrosophila lebanonensis]|uniref:Uncharacterized protein LOC115624881 n=1 Tax=Drosophila lebanonensis TaxID=7225 RepID=A0A6J2TKN7_DROLE|nr:uncharacterized protein LOC115624881 [Scaptodrosophila lebanonensis]